MKATVIWGHSNCQQIQVFFAQRYSKNCKKTFN